MSKKIEFAERLGELMTIKNYNILTLSKASGLSKTAIGFWLKYNIYPSINNLIKLSDFFNCSLDYFTARSDDFTEREFFKNFAFVERIDFLIKENGISYYRLSKDLNIDERNFTRWKKSVLPRTETVLLIAEYFNVSLDFLLGRSNLQ